MTKQDLLPLAKTYFDSSPELKEIFGTEDKHFFYKEIQAQKYCKREREYFHYVPSDFEIKEEKLTKKQKLQNEAKELGVDFDEKTKVADLEVLIELKKEEDN
jgi:hypothetical protein